MRWKTFDCRWQHLTHTLPARGTPPNPWDPAQRDGAQMMQDTLAQWRSQGRRPDLWVFGYASLVWRPEFEAAEQRLARVPGYHRCLQACGAGSTAAPTSAPAWCSP